MPDETPAGELGGETYRQAVERAGVVELPDDGSNALLPGLLAGRFEDNDPPGAPR